MATLNYEVTSENYTDMGLTSAGISDGQSFLICNNSSDTVYFVSATSTPSISFSGIPIKANDSGNYTKNAGENLYVKKKHEFSDNAILVLEL